MSVSDSAADSDLFALLRTRPGTPLAAAADHVLVGRYTWLVEHTARQYLGRGEQLEELRQIGFVGLMKAIRRFDPEKQTEFSAYAWPTVRGEIRKHFRDRRRWVQIPRKLQEHKQRITAAAEEFAQREGRDPRTEELAAALGLAADDVRAALAAPDNFTPFSLDAPLTTEDGDAGTWGEMIGHDDHDLDLFIEFEAVRSLLDGLPCRERRVLLLRFYGNRTQQEIAEATGLTQIQVSRILKRLLTTLRAALCTA